MAGRMHNLAGAPSAPPPGRPLDMHDAIFSQHYRQGEGYYMNRPHGTATWLMFYTMRGYGWFRSPAREVETASPRDVHLYPPGRAQEYGAVAHTGWDFHWVHFIPRPTWAPLLALAPVAAIPGLLRARASSTVTHRRLLTAFEDLHRDAMVTGANAQELAFNALERVLLLVREGRAGQPGRTTDPRIQRILEAIAMAPAGRYTLAGLARSVQLSPSRLAHLFKASTGTTLFETVINTRLREATNLLRMGTARVQEVATRAGFNSPFYFSRRFTLKYGISPSEYRIRSLRGQAGVGRSKP